LGERVMARTFERQVVELQVRAAVLNRYTHLGTPVTQLWRDSVWGWRKLVRGGVVQQGRRVVQEKDIVSCDDAGHVQFRYRDAQSGKMTRRTLPGADFLWLVLQHVLPKGLRRARNFGFLHPNSFRAGTRAGDLMRILQLRAKVDASGPPAPKRSAPRVRIVVASMEHPGGGDEGQRGSETAVAAAQRAA
jgi:hypothetical protein